MNNEELIEQAGDDVKNKNNEIFKQFIIKMLKVKKGVIAELDMVNKDLEEMKTIDVADAITKYRYANRYQIRDKYYD
jgi:S-adenosylhomocysteine hydrolase